MKRLTHMTAAFALATVTGLPAAAAVAEDGGKAAAGGAQSSPSNTPDSSESSPTKVPAPSSAASGSDAADTPSEDPSTSPSSPSSSPSQTPSPSTPGGSSPSLPSPSPSKSTDTSSPTTQVPGIQTPSQAIPGAVAVPPQGAADGGNLAGSLKSVGRPGVNAKANGGKHKQQNVAAIPKEQAAGGGETSLDVSVKQDPVVTADKGKNIQAGALPKTGADSLGTGVVAASFLMVGGGLLAYRRRFAD